MLACIGVSIVLVVVFNVVLVVLNDSRVVSIELEGNGLPIFIESHVGIDQCLRYSVHRCL